MTLIPVRMIPRAELARLGNNLDATVRHDRHLAAANRSLKSLGEIANWLARPRNGKKDDDDRNDFGGAAGALVPA